MSSSHKNTSSEIKMDYKELYNAAPCGYLCSLPNGQIIEANNRFLEFTGYDKEEVIHKKKIPDFLSKAGKIYYESSFLIILKLQGYVKELGFSLVNKDNTQIPILLNSEEVKNDKGECIYVQTTVFNISQRKKFENQLLRAKKESDRLSKESLELNKELQSFSYIAAHDLKTPILDIEGHFNYLKSKLPLDDEYTQESIGFIEDSISQFKTTADGLTEAIKLKNTNPILEKIDLSEIITQLLPSFKSKIQIIDGLLKVNIKENTFIEGNNTFVTSIIKNIVSNAINYCSKERKLEVTIETKFNEEFIQLIVTDNGIGIDLDLHKDKIFRIFNRFNDQTEGTGMGLYLTAKMLEQMNGKVTVNSKPGIGSCFKIFFKKLTQ